MAFNFWTKRHHVAIQIEAMLAKAKPLYTNACCIYRVPHNIRNLNQDAYTPKVVSIGPLHHENTKLLNMEGHKLMYCKKFIERSDASLDNLVSCVQELEPAVRRCYSETIKLSVEEFVKMILVDCGFIIELFLRDPAHQDNISLRPWLREDILWDLLLLENQLPFFVFERLYNLAFVFPLNVRRSFLLLARHCLPIDRNLENFPPTGSIAHFTDLCRTCQLQPSNRRPHREAEPLEHLYSATELNEAGVKFRVNESPCFLDLQLSGCYLKIPKLTVMDSTEIMLRNMVAFEQCHYPEESYITDYVELFDFLINTDKDVDILIKKGVMVNWLGDSNAVAELFNGLCRNITVGSSNTNYRRICKELNAYYEHPCITTMATLKRDYCNTPWKTVASIAGIGLIILTLIQTACSIRQVV